MKTYTLKIIQATIKNGQAVYYCKYCKRNHIHGAMSGQRHSHCTNQDSPNYGKEFYLEVVED